MIKSRAHLRRLIEAAEQIAEDGFDTANDLDEIMDKAERDILGVTRSRRATDFKSSREVVSNVMQELIRLRSSDNCVTGIKTGYTDLDRMTNGFQRGDLIILAARPAMGKTAFECILLQSRGNCHLLTGDAGGGIDEAYSECQVRSGIQ